MPIGQVGIRFYLPHLMFYLPRAGGQCLMSSPVSNVKMIILKKENRISFSHWTDEKSGNPEKAGRMATLFTQLLKTHNRQ